MWVAKLLSTGTAAAAMINILTKDKTSSRKLEEYV
jgi:hypothetical protein